MLDKRLQLGGLQVGGPRTMQNVVRFRVADNVYQNRDGYMIPRFHCAQELAILPAEEVEIIQIAQYKNLPFSMAKWGDTGGMKFYYNGIEVLTTLGLEGPTPIDFSDFGFSSALGIQTVEKLGCLFIHFPLYGLFKFDGTQMYRAGVPLPYFSCAQYAGAGAAYIRVIQHRIDFQGNIINSGYVQFRATPTANTVLIRHDLSTTDILDNVEVSPKRRTSKFNGTYDEWFYVGSGAGVIDTGLREVTIPSTDKIVQVGNYLMISASEISATVTGFPGKSYGIAFKVKSFDATHVVLDMNDVKWLDAAGQWNDTYTLSNTTTLFATATIGSNYWMSLWTSNVATGNYVWKKIFPALYQSLVNHTETVDVTSLIVPTVGYDLTGFNLSGNLGDIYDVTTNKDIYPSLASSWGVTTSSPYSFSTFGDLALISYENEIYFPDTTLGGAFEMANGISFIVVGEGDDGPIQSVCGTSDFFIVSRQYQNYYVSGNLATSNYRVQSLPQTSIGSYSNESVIAYQGSVILLNKAGIWAIYAGGKCEEVSQYIRGFFDDWSASYSFAEMAHWDITSHPDYATPYGGTYFTVPTTENLWIRARADIVRGLVYFVIPGTDDLGKVLVLNMNNGEYYTWSGLSSALGVTVPNVKDICPINGFYHVAVNSSDYSAKVFKEFKTGATRYDYGDCQLETSWFVAGEPSLEKKLNQIKMWGIITCPVVLSHFLDWVTTTATADGTYTTATATTFSHKQRLAPANFQAVSIKMLITPGEDVFQMEGLEVEWQPFQQGMKK